MKRANWYFALVLGSAGMLGLGQAQPAPLTVQHDEGTARIEKTPERLLVIDEEALGWIYALNLEDRVVGLGSSYITPAMLDGSRVKPEVLKRGFFGHGRLNAPTYVGSWTAPNLETVTALRPDLVVQATWDGNENYEKLNAVAPTLGYKEGGADYWKKAVTDLGEIFGRQERAAAVTQLPANVNRYNHAALEAAGVFQRFPKVVVVAPFAGGSNWVYGSTRLIDDLRALGFKDGIQLDKTTLDIGAEVSEEALLGLDDQTLVVLFPPGGEYNGAKAFMQSAVGQRLKDQTVLYEPEEFSPYAGPLTQARNSNRVTKAILDFVR
ncbi:ABC transporter substrate-binding protein [Deinococcus sp. Marseille-Q6407]|uniref:ABC transporter substrate-binding protein n=1 Tax=Deinococcus sp. Marseille-Q6407 TaxID=2969223 RepID=UPI0021C14D52|nr:ABC transporter substrate-binding protein [Deinococcus sp. Marseille-Q6407]